MSGKFLRFLTMLIVLVITFNLKMAASEYNVELVTGSPRYLPKDVSHPWPLPGLLGHLIDIYQANEIDKNGSTEFSNNFTMENDDLGTTYNSNTERPEVAQIQMKKMQLVKSVFTAPNILGIAGVILVSIFMLVAYRKCSSCKKRSDSTSHPEPVVTFQNEHDEPHVAVQMA